MCVFKFSISRDLSQKLPSREKHKDKNKIDEKKALLSYHSKRKHKHTLPYQSLSLLNQVLLLATHSFQLNLKSIIENIHFLLNHKHIFFLTKFTTKSYSFPRKVQHQKHIEVCHFIKF
jgi:hypothetical protein